MLTDQFPTRVVNLRYTVWGLHFDAAIDCNWQLHCYEENPIRMENVVPIELYCFDHTEWDIKMIYQDRKNEQPRMLNGRYFMQHTEVDMGEIIEETKKWIEEEMNGVDCPKLEKDNEEDRNTLF